MDHLSEKISDSELEVMRVLWEAGDALPITDIRRILQDRKGWEATTVKTLVQRLVSKGVLGQEKRKVFFYRPLVSESEYSDWAVNGMVQRLFRGSAKALVATLVQSDGLSDADIAELRAFFKVED
ncbi:MAG: BlaI/MecI/CopY family transcriptional regulator [Oscillospiraceae bacterium]|nr:BlaI/MecI/CopY family transcriptional regulator [Oscillospiraceae bacterium]